MPLTPESPKGLDRAGDQLRFPIPHCPVRQSQVARKVGQIETQPAKGPPDYADTGRIQVQPAYAMALRVRPVPVACPHDLVEQVIRV